jgi:sugar lactone lactonase YvrE
MSRRLRTGRAALLAFLAGGVVLLGWRSGPPPAVGDRAPQAESPYHQIEVIAGDSDFGDGGMAIRALFIGIGGLAADPKGNLYVTDTGGNRVRRIDGRTGMITTVAGTGLLIGDMGSKVAVQRPLRGPAPLALDAKGRFLYVAEILGRRVLKIDLASGAIEDLGAPPGGFGTPSGLAWTPAGLLVTDSPRGQVWKQGSTGWTGLLPENARPLGNIRTVAQDGQGRIYLAEYFTHRVLRWDPATATMDIVLGTGEKGRGAGGTKGAQTQIRTPDGIAVDRKGNLWVVDKGNHRIGRVDAATGVFEILAESNEREKSERWTPGPLAVDPEGNLWVGDIESNRVLRFAPGARAPVAVAGEGDIGDNGPARAARLAHPGSVVADARGNIYVSDTLHHRIRVIDAATGRIRTLAGNGEHGYNGDGIPATQASLSYPAELQVDAAGRIYFGDYYNHRVRMVDPESGLIFTLAGNGRAGEDGDGGPAASARVINPHALFLDDDGSLIIASAVSSKLRRIDLASGKISALPLGEGVPEELAFYGMTRWNGGLVMAQPRPGGIDVLKDGRISPLIGRPEIFFPQDVAVSSKGELFICETGRNRVMKWTGKELKVVVENLGRPRAISFDAKGNLLIADTLHNRLLRLRLEPDPGAVVASGRP